MVAQYGDDKTLTPRFGAVSIVMLTIAFYSIFLFVRPFVRESFNGRLDPGAGFLSSLILGYTWMWAPPVILAILLFGFRQAPRALGLSASISKGFAFGFITTAPVLVYYGLTAGLSTSSPLWEVAVKSAAMPALFEEILFRACVFGFLFRFAKWGFLPAALFGAALFGLGHISQGNSVLQALAVFGFTAIGALWFSWLYIEWKYNLWIPIAVHFFMNFYWSAFEISGTAAGNTEANILRLLSIVLTIIITIYFARRRGGLNIKGKTWWLHNKKKLAMSAMPPQQS